MSRTLNRRDFLARTAAAGIGVGLASGARFLSAQTVQAVPTPPAGADKLRGAVIGTNSRGLGLIAGLIKAPSVELACICDCEDGAIAKGMKAAKSQPTAPRTEKDFRKVLDDKSIDFVAIATPDHWHAPMSILALTAGKHVYVEKPCTHNPREGELLLQAIDKYKRVVQMGAQRRSFPNLRKAIQEIHDGALGKTYFARAWYANDREPIGKGKLADVPPGLDYELWQGPAPRRPYRDNVIPYKWHWFWHYGTGEALNNGTHEIDVCRWALQLGFPSRVTSSGGRYHFQDDWETPDTQVISWDFPQNKTMSWEGRSCNAQPVEGLSRGAVVYGTEGSALLDADNATFYDKKGKVTKTLGKKGEKVDATNTLSSTGATLDNIHITDFIDAIRTGRQPNCPISEGHVSTTLLHLGNIAYRTGRLLNTDPATGHIQNDPDAAKLWQRDYEKGWEPTV